MRRIAVATITPAVLLLAACGSSSTSSSSTSAAPRPASAEQPEPAAPTPVGLQCGDIGGVFEPHGTDGRGSCVPADPRPECHVPPAQQPENYVADFVMDPPFPGGTISPAVVRTSLGGVGGVPAAANASCWRMPS